MSVMSILRSPFFVISQTTKVFAKKPMRVQCRLNSSLSNNLNHSMFGTSTATLHKQFKYRFFTLSPTAKTRLCRLFNTIYVNKFNHTMSLDAKEGLAEPFKKPGANSNTINAPLLSVSETSRSYSSSTSQNGTPPRLMANESELKRWSWLWWKEWTIIFVVFGITGSTTVRLVKPILTHVLGIQGTLFEGPWSYRFAYLSITLPLYSIILYGVGTIFGRQAYFKMIVTRMWGRLIPTRFIKYMQRRKANIENGGNSSGL